MSNQIKFFQKVGGGCGVDQEPRTIGFLIVDFFMESNRMVPIWLVQFYNKKF